MTRSNFDLRTWTRISVLAVLVVMLGAVIVGHGWGCSSASRWP